MGRRLNPRSCGTAILDLLELEDGWLTADHIESLLPDRFNPPTIRRVIQRLASYGLLERGPDVEKWVTKPARRQHCGLPNFKGPVTVSEHVVPVRVASWRISQRALLQGGDWSTSVDN